MSMSELKFANVSAASRRSVAAGVPLALGLQRGESRIAYLVPRELPVLGNISAVRGQVAAVNFASSGYQRGACVCSHSSRDLEETS